jgi:fermentation-respiration switch protein FrsA (DUF1100 family)
MFDAGNNTPALDGRLTADWTLLEYFTAKDALALARLAGRGERVYYGALLQSKADPTLFVGAIRGTETTIEWLEDGLAVLANHVHAGFYGIFDSMECGMPALPAVRGVSARVPPGSRVIFIGHSLGAPLAAYLLMAAIKMNIDATGMFFAMPKPGDGDFAIVYDGIVGQEKYIVFDYSRDRVPNLPLTIYPLHMFAHLRNRVVISPKDSTAVIPDDVAENHRAVNYAALLAGLKPA